VEDQGAEEELVPLLVPQHQTLFSVPWSFVFGQNQHQYHQYRKRKEDERDKDLDIRDWFINCQGYVNPTVNRNLSECREKMMR
jgi:hypothetical protein